MILLDGQHEKGIDWGANGMGHQPLPTDRPWDVLESKWNNYTTSYPD